MYSQVSLHNHVSLQSLLSLYKELLTVHAHARLTPGQGGEEIFEMNIRAPLRPTYYDATSLIHHVDVESRPRKICCSRIIALYTSINFHISIKRVLASIAQLERLVAVNLESCRR
jgi:hypothetical protein